MYNDRSGPPDPNISMDGLILPKKPKAQTLGLHMPASLGWQRETWGWVICIL